MFFDHFSDIDDLGAARLRVRSRTELSGA